jgi:hypothetical protein
MRSIVRIGLIAALTACASVTSPSACSVCRCGDNAFQFSDQALPLAGQSDIQRFRFSLANTYSTKSNALSPDEGPGTERQREFRPSAKAMYQLSDHFGLSAELPLSFRRLQVTTDDGIEHERSSGFGDAELSTLWMTNFASANGRHYSAGLSASFKLPTGHNNAKSDGARADEHLQGGTGSYDVTLGGAIARSTCASRIFASAYFRRNGTNEFDYHYGNAMLFNLGAQRSFSSVLIGSLQLNGRHARRDFESGAIVDNTGGSVAYMTPGVRVALGEITSLSLSVQIPVWQDLYGTQDEKAVLGTGISFSL